MMDESRRQETVLLCLAAVVTALGMALVCAALGDSPLRATRGIVPVGVILVAAAVMDLLGRRRDRTILPLVAMICGMGLITLWRLDPFRASKQVVWMVMGVALMLSTYLLISEVRNLRRLKYVCGVGAVLLLLATMIWGEERFGARLWLNLGFIPAFQPMEFSKILLAVFLSGYVAERGQLISAVGRDRWGLPLVELGHLGPIVLIVAFCLAIFITQRDLGAAALVFGLAVAVMYLGTGRRTYVILGTVAFAGGALVASQMFWHVQRRLVSWLNPWSDPTDAGLQTLQAMFAFGEGGLLGTGLGLGMPYRMPAVETDLIFGAVGEEMGLAGTCGLLALYAMLVFSGFSIAWRCRDRFGMLLAASVTTVLGLQTLVILGGVVRALPLTGITLPFVSYGGTSIIVNFIAVGLLLAVSRDCTGPPPSPSPAGRPQVRQRR